jgi:hypothetical protein
VNQSSYRALCPVAAEPAREVAGNANAQTELRALEVPWVDDAFPRWVPSATPAVFRTAATAVSAVLEAVTAFTRHGFDADGAVAGDLLGLDQQMRELHQPMPGGHSLMVARPDIVITGSGVNVLELNVGSTATFFPLYDLLARAQLSDDKLRQVIHDRQLTPTFAMPCLAAAIREATSAQRILLTLWEYEYAQGAKMFHLYALEHELRRQGFGVHRVTVEDLPEQPVDGIPTTVYRIFGRPRTPVEFAAFQALRRELYNRGWHLVSDFHGDFISNKAHVARAVEWYEMSPGGNPATQSVLRSCVPWTRVVEDGRTGDFAAQGVDLVEFAVRSQVDLVLKSGFGFGGREVIFGAEVSATEWRAALTAALTSPSPSIVQRVVNVDGPAVVYGALCVGGTLVSLIQRRLPPGASTHNVSGSLGAIPSPVYLGETP